MLDLPLPTRRNDPPERRKETALAALALFPHPDCTIWSDGSAKEGTIQGGGGAILELHREGRHIECVAPAGRVCSNMRAELEAMTESLSCLQELPLPSSSLVKSVLLCSDSRSGLQLLSRGPDDQQSAIGQRVWSLLDALTARGMTITPHLVPGHADLAGNEAANRLANQTAADCDQEEAQSTSPAPGQPSAAGHRSWPPHGRSGTHTDRRLPATMSWTGWARSPCPSSAPATARCTGASHSSSDRPGRRPDLPGVRGGGGRHGASWLSAPRTWRQAPGTGGTVLPWRTCSRGRPTTLWSS